MKMEFLDIRHDPGSDPMTTPEPGWKKSSEFQYKMEVFGTHVDFIGKLDFQEIPF